MGPRRSHRLVPRLSNFERVRCLRVLGCSVGTLLIIIIFVQRHYMMFLAPSYPKKKPIPNVIHYTMMMKDELAEFDINFLSFLSVYSALRILNSQRIYIHTDFNETMIEQARKVGNKWTRLILDVFPEIIINHVPFITQANGQRILAVEHRSDMVRFDQVYEKGGIYLDFDVYALRDAQVLREAGFNNVVGRQAGGQLNNGCFMSQPKSALAYLMKRDQWKVFDGEWETHSIHLLTQISERLVRSPGEVLILDQLAMAPWSWEFDDFAQLYFPHKESVPQSPQVNDANEEPISRWENRMRGLDWELDFSSVYFLHAFRPFSSIYSGLEEVNVDFILKRSSNFALATWHIVQIGLKEGIFVGTESETFVVSGK